MNFLSVNTSHLYKGNSLIRFSVDPETRALEASVETQRLFMRSVKADPTDYARYTALYGDARVMEKFGTGETKSPEYVEDRIKNVWAKRWREHDPYSGLAVFEKNTEDFLGNIVLGYGDLPGEAELAYLFHYDHWKKGYGTEAVNAIVKEYSAATIQEKYTLKQMPLNTIKATARSTNLASNRILERVGMTLSATEYVSDFQRNHYVLDLLENPLRFYIPSNSRN